MTPLAKQKGTNPPSKQEVIAVMIYEGVKEIPVGKTAFGKTTVVDFNDYIYLAQKILNYLEEK